jgi:hypothetical protein
MLRTVTHDKAETAIEPVPAHFSRLPISHDYPVAEPLQSKGILYWLQWKKNWLSLGICIFVSHNAVWSR